MVKTLRKAALLLSLPILFQVALSGADRTADWKQVDKALQDGQPQTASAALDKIITGALADGADAEALKAILQKTQTDASIEKRSEQPAYIIRSLNAWASDAPPADVSGAKRLALSKSMRPLLEAALAKTWVSYYQANRWTLLQRTRTAETPSEDFMTWDAARVVAEAGKHFEAALAEPEALRRTPIGTLAPLLTEGDLPDKYRPTLYDFLMFEAIGFYSMGEQGIPKPEDHFQPDVDSPLLGSVEEFLKWSPATSSSNEPGKVATDPTLQAIQLYQELLRFHQSDQEQVAYADVDLQRMTWAASLIGSNADERYRNALETFAERWQNQAPVMSVIAYARIAEKLESGNPAEAHAKAKEAIRLAANCGAEATPVANACHNIVARLEAPALQRIITERTWTEPWPDISVRYRNQEKIWFRVIAWDWEKLIQEKGYSAEYISPEQRRKIFARKPAKTWSASLSPTPDFCYRVEKVSAPRGLKPGFYIIAASFDENFSESKNTLSYTTVWVSTLSIVVDQNGIGNPSGYVVNAVTGEPMKNIDVFAWYRPSGGDRVQMQPVTTDTQGAFTFEIPVDDQRQYLDYLYLARGQNGEAVSTSNPTYAGFGFSEGNEDPWIYFFTDRSIYRPGQTIQFKAVMLRPNAKGDGGKLLTNRRITVVLQDPNGKEAGSSELRTNEFGSVSGSFTVPAGRLTGHYMLRAKGGENGASHVRIEEYKRPKFEVALAAPEIAPKLGGTVVLGGTATAYTGAPIDGSKVSWRVRRLVRWPRWCWWALPTTTNREIAHGTATTGNDGKFGITFDAIPDKAADPKNEPIFDYAVSVEVTDTTGETRTATRTVSIGYTALSANVGADAWQTSGTPVKITISTASLDGVGQKAQGTLKLYPLLQPESVPQRELMNNRYYGYETSTESDPSDVRTWPEKAVIDTQAFSTSSETGIAEVSMKLPAGIYRAVVDTQDRFGKPVAARTEIRVVDPDAKRYNIKEAFSLTAASWDAQPGETITALWGSGHDSARALVSIEQNGKILRRYWTAPSVTQEKLPIKITEAMRGGVTVRLFQMRNNRLSTDSRDISIPWDNKRLTISWEHFNSKLVPGGRETWTAKITGPNSTQIAAEMSAALYDASLDQFYPHSWSDLLGIFRGNYSRGQWVATNSGRWFTSIVTNPPNSISSAKINLSHREWSNPFGDWEIRYLVLLSGDGDIVMMDAFRVDAAPAKYASRRQSEDSVALAAPMATEPLFGKQVQAEPPPPESPEPDLTAVTARKNLSETAFFYPQLLTDANGTVRIEFTAPEALTRWKFLGFAHDKELRSAVLTDTAVTAKDLMVQPNPPRFLREGDTVEFTVKVTNRTDQEQSGSAQLTFADASSLAAVNLLTGASKSPTQNFKLAANSSQTLSWRIAIPDGQGFLTYKAVASTGTVSDGEEGFLPVLSRRQLVTESIALPIRDAGTRTFRFDKLAASGSDTALRNESLTVQMTSNPAWYAVLALPSLMEFPYECSEQIFNRYYANALSTHIAKSDPKIARVFEQWRNTPATDSPLLQNEDLKSVLIEETPWVRAATRESEQRRAVGQLFEVNRTTAQMDSILRTLTERQRADGLWAWFPGGDGSEYITRYLVAGFARLQHFGITLDERGDAMLKKAIPALDKKYAERYEQLQKSKDFDKKNNYLSSSDAYQLYMRSFFTKAMPIPESARAAYDFFTAQAEEYWLQLPRQSQGHAALALSRLGKSAAAAKIVESLRQRAKNDAELGMYWTDVQSGWFWWQAPIETQALMIEVFDEIAKDKQIVADLQLWLLKQKQTQAWSSTKSTADAVYALLLRGTDKLASDALVSISLGNQKIEPAKTEAGTGFYSERIPGVSVTPAMGETITVTKTDAGPAWGSVTWQYLQTIDKITPHEGTPLKLKKSIWKQENTSKGPTLVPLTSTTLNPGDTLIVRIELRTDRDMEFVHLKDQRGSGTEPVNVLSGYRWKGGLGYYESTRDTATHFFIERLNAGTYVFEYPVRVQLRGRYESGIAEIQCMYAPEFNSHSESTTIVVE